MDLKVKLLEALHAYLEKEKIDWTEEVSEDEWLALFRMAAAQRILPMVFEAVYLCPALQRYPQLLATIRKQVYPLVMSQAAKTADFLDLYRKLLQAGQAPLVVKGLLCRILYPDPDFRSSGDEDLYLSPQQISLYHPVFQSHGMVLHPPTQNLAHDREISYVKRDTGLYLEVHKSLFAEDSEAYGDFNRFFSSASSRCTQQDVQGVSIRTLDHSHHFLYLLLHALKHFMHSGFGIRQVCDIVLYANTYGSSIHWDEVYRACQHCRAHRFGAALFQIGIRYLTLDPKRAGIPAQWLSLPVDCEPMLDDLLSGGVYGNANASRQHSATITLNAVAAHARGSRARPSLLASVFPSARSLAGRYPYLKRRPYLLPVAWATRIFTYRKELAASHGKAAMQAIQIGNQRVALLRNYQIIP